MAMCLLRHRNKHLEAFIFMYTQGILKTGTTFPLTGQLNFAVMARDE